MKKIYSLILLILITLNFTACGGGGGGSSFNQSTQEITVSCLTSPTTAQIATYVEVYSGDSIIKNSDSTVVQVYTAIGQNTRVCLQSGAAYVLRR